MPYRTSMVTRNAIVDTVSGLLAQGGNPTTSLLIIYSNATSQPVSPDTAVPGGSVILAEIPLSATAFAASSNGTASANGLPLESTILANGTAGWFRIRTGAGTPQPHHDGSITVTGGGGDITFGSISFVIGGTVRITSLQLTSPLQSN